MNKDNKKSQIIVKEGNIRDYADLFQLVILNNLENINAELIEMNISQKVRLVILNNIAKRQMNIIKNSESFANLEYLENKINKTYIIE